ncbi:permease-like cell division protein FtsX [Alkalihalobacillus sp. LMS39]|uniref:permease-like cell division protein FtsX n=1 Tax=Alkalihalobacillus sp. LMS39 TaxID=2924032 RepID=UPI001FB3BD78|nr:permease-like cell division protein FtsX [Alkalihalobacillus sp. LMS39]UOE93776.1 permease-like cell division protein FtsX [Alkalihalobacillus sp. LMS39]
MKFRTLKRHGKEGAKNLIRNGWMTFASISAVSILLLIVGVFLLLILNMNHIASLVEDDVEIRVHVDLTASEEQQEELQSLLEQVEHVESVEYVPREEGLELFIESMDDMGEVFEGLRGENPFNDAFVVRATTPQLTENVANQITELPHVESINYGKDVVDRLFAVTDLVRNIGLILVIAMMFTAMFLIANTIKLTIVARKREIQIMKLVGATNGFIRWPFFIEGLLLGTIGAMIPIVVIVIGYSYLFENFSERIEFMFFELVPVFPYVYQVGILLLVIGAFIGVWGSLMSVRKFLRV